MSVITTNKVEAIACRGCLTTDGKLYSIIDARLYRPYEDLIGYPVGSSEFYPKYLCVYCQQQLLRFQSFRLQCRKVIEILKDAQTAGYALTTGYIRSIDRNYYKLNSRYSQTSVDLIECVHDQSKDAFVNNNQNLAKDTVKSINHEHNDGYRLRGTIESLVGKIITDNIVNNDKVLPYDADNSANNNQNDDWSDEYLDINSDSNIEESDSSNTEKDTKKKSVNEKHTKNNSNINKEDLGTEIAPVTSKYDAKNVSIDKKDSCNKNDSNVDKNASDSDEEMKESDSEIDELINLFLHSPKDYIKVVTKVDDTPRAKADIAKTNNSSLKRKAKVNDMSHKKANIAKTRRKTLKTKANVFINKDASDESNDIIHKKANIGKTDEEILETNDEINAKQNDSFNIPEKLGFNVNDMIHKKANIDKTDEEILETNDEINAKQNDRFTIPEKLGFNVNDMIHKKANIDKTDEEILETNDEINAKENDRFNIPEKLGFNVNDMIHKQANIDKTDEEILETNDEINAKENDRFTIPEKLGFNVKYFTKQEQLDEIKKRREGIIKPPYTKCEVCGAVFATAAKKMTHYEQYHNPNDPYTCLICHYRFDRKRLLTLHSLIHKREFSCQNCEFVTRNRDNLSTHYIKFHREELPTHICAYCGKVFKKMALFQHMRSKHPTELLSCELCNKILFNKKQLKKHYNSVHCDVKKMNCQCNKMFLNQDALAKHEASKRCDLYPCQRCGVNLTTDQQLKYHLYKHKMQYDMFEDYYYECGGCKVLFQCSDALETHVLGCLEGGFPCVHCGESLSNEDLLKEHLFEKHSLEEDLFNVEAFRKSSAVLKKHQLAHSDRPRTKRKRPRPIDSFDCHICDKSFPSNVRLEYHMCVHTGERPYSCEHCMKTFKHLSGLYKHKMQHHVENHHVCPICGESFQKRRYRDDHIKDAHVANQRIPENEEMETDMLKNSVKYDTIENHEGSEYLVLADDDDIEIYDEVTI